MKYVLAALLAIPYIAVFAILLAPTAIVSLPYALCALGLDVLGDKKAANRVEDKIPVIRFMDWWIDR